MASITSSEKWKISAYSGLIFAALLWVSLMFKDKSPLVVTTAMSIVFVLIVRLSMK